MPNFDKLNSGKNSKVKIILLSLLIVILIGVAMWAYNAIILENSKSFTLYIDNVKQANSSGNENILKYIKTDSGVTYIAIKPVVELVTKQGIKYKYNDGDLFQSSSSDDRANIQIPSLDGKKYEEYICIYENSKEIRKYDNNTEKATANVDYVTLSKEIIKDDNNLFYVAFEDAPKVLDLTVAFDKTKNKLSINTLNYYMQYAKQNIPQFDVNSVENKFRNLKALLYGIAITKDSNNNNYGLNNLSDNKEIVSQKFSEITFWEGNNEFLTKTAAGYGIISDNGLETVKNQYDEIKSIYKKIRLYGTRKDRKWGVLNSEGRRLIDIEYDSLGLDSREANANDFDNKYVLNDKILVAKRDNKYRFFDTISGEEFTNSSSNYERIGCEASSIRSINKLFDYSVENTYTIPEITGDRNFNGLVVQKSKTEKDENGRDVTKKIYVIVDMDTGYETAIGNGVDFIEGIVNRTDKNKTTYYVIFKDDTNQMAQTDINTMLDYIERHPEFHTGNSTENDETTNTTTNTIETTNTTD